MSEGIKAMNLHFPEREFLKLKKKKEESKARSWEAFILKAAGIAE